MTRPGGRRGSQPAGSPPGDWIVALPAWGDRCVRVAADYTIPALADALVTLARPYQVVIYSDQQDVLADIARDHGMRTSPSDVPGPDGAFESLSNCHRDALSRATGGDRVCLLTADMVVSTEILATAEAAVMRGCESVCCCAMRALEDRDPPVGADGATLLRWAWENRHPMTRECTWPEGRSYDIWRMYFERDGEVAARVFLPHPLVVLPRGRKMTFSPTIDVNLANNFPPSQTHMITDPSEGAVVELSPEDKEFLYTEPMRARLADTSIPSIPPLVRASHARHHRFFGKRVTVRTEGGGSCGDEEVVARVLG